MTSLHRFIIGTVFVALLQPAPAAGEVSRATADWIRANAATLNGVRHSVQVVAVRPARLDDGTQWFSVFTWDGHGNGSWIEAVVPAADASTFLTKYGTTVPTYMLARTPNKRLDAVVRVGPRGEVFLEVNNALATPAPSSGNHSRVRAWTDQQGRSFVGEYLSSDATHVVIRRHSDGQTFTIDQARLSQPDRDWIAANR